MESIRNYNVRHLEALSKILRNGSAIALIGAGSSIACGYPGWDDFLESLERPLRGKLNDDYLRELRKRNPRTRLDEMAGMLGDEYPVLFRDTFKPNADRHDAVPWVRLLSDLNVSLILTTNYTTELEQTLPRSSQPASEFQIVRWYENKFSNALRRTRPGRQLIYLHGHWDDSPEMKSDDRNRKWSQIILGEKSYQYAYEFPGEVRKALEATCRMNTLLIIGASLDDTDVTGVLRAVKASTAEGTNPHYVILPLSSDRSPEVVAAEYLQRFGLQPLFYPLVSKDKGSLTHEALDNLLKELVDRVSRRDSVRSPICLKQDQPFTDPLTGIHMLPITGGHFQIGLGRKRELPAWIKLSPYWVGEIPVTNRQYGVFLASHHYPEPDFWNDRRFNDSEQPVVGVSWNDAKEFCAWLCGATGLNWALCTEAQWEFAARGNDGRKYPWGNDDPTERLACYGLDRAAGQPAPAGVYRFGCGPFGTLDQAGNVWEWCYDNWTANAYELWRPSEPLDPVITNEGGDRVLRGGCWIDSPKLISSAIRYRRPSTYRATRVGFRVAVR